MRDIATVSLHLVRSGSPHNQLVSPITTYLGLCGRYGVSTVRLPWEHADLEQDIARLRYTRVDDKGGRVEVTRSEREHTLRDLGCGVGAILRQLGGLGAELALAERIAGGSGMTHLRIRLWGNELGMVPFEVGIAPPGHSGEGLRLALRGHGPVCITREILGAHTLADAWDREVRVLFAWASPGGEVPHASTLYRVHEAVSRLLPWDGDPAVRRARVKAQLTILPFVTLEQLHEACSAAAYTHVFLLAHGASTQVGGHTRYGVALHRAPESNEAVIVDGERLALAFGATVDGGSVRVLPNVVTLAICDSANEGDVVVPGGSVAHSLHEQGVPWVIASQFPLNFEAADVLASTWMGALLDGTDPRWALHLLRSALARLDGDAHDWGSIVAYGSFPDGFETSFECFAQRQLGVRIRQLEESARNVATYLNVDGTEPSPPIPEDQKDRQKAAVAVLRGLGPELDRVFRLADRTNPPPAAELGKDPTHDQVISRALAADLRAEFLTTLAAVTKRAGVAMDAAGEKGEARVLLLKALERYRLADVSGTRGHWPKVQALSLAVGLDVGPTAKEWREAVAAATRSTHDPADAVWAWAGLVELHLLASNRALAAALRPGEPINHLKELRAAAREFMKAAQSTDGFPVKSTVRQLKLYRGPWKDHVDATLLDAALKILKTGESLPAV